MKGLSYPTGQLVPEGFGGYAPDIPVPQYDPELSRKLLAEAGWPKGFRIKMHCMDQFGALCQALAQMFTRVGIRVELEVMPRPAYWPKMNDRNGGSGSLYISSWGASSSGEANVLETVVHSFDKERNVGSWNLTRYANPAIDALIDKIMIEENDAARHAMQATAMKMAMADLAVIPVHVQAFVVATRKGLDLTMFASGNVYATSITTKK